MGQYYKFINIDKKEKCDRNKDLLKLTEHSYLANEYCLDILTLISDEWKGDRIIHVGDYAEGNDDTTTSELISEIEKDNNLEQSVYSWGQTFKETAPKRVNKKIRYVYNLNRKEYIDLEKQPIQWCCIDDNKILFAKFNAFALLIGCGNGLGGGDYFGINDRKIGLWAGDKFESSSTLLNEYANFKEQKYIFDEYLELNKRIKTINEKTEKIILNSEGILLKHFLERIKDYEKVDLSKVEIDRKGLTDNEFKHFNIVLKKYKNKESNKSQISEKQKNNLIKNNNAEISSFDELIL